MKAGDKVICVRIIGDKDQYGLDVIHRPEKGKIYTISRIVENNGNYFLCLVEFEGDWAYEIECFRKLLPKKQLQRELAEEAIKESQRKGVLEEITVTS